MFKHKKPSSGPPSTVAIKRVLRVGGRFTCGVCRRVYANEAQAEHCLSNCLHAHLNPPDTIAAEAGGKRFRCHFCKRVYGDRDAAKRCATSCRNAAQAAVEKEAALKAGPSAPLAKPTASAPTASSTSEAAEKPRKQRAPVRRNQEHKYLREGRKLICRKCGTEHATLDTVIACYDGHPAHVKKVAPVNAAPPTQAPKPAAAAAPVEPTVAPSPPPAAASGDDASKFSRDGARYVCRNCHKKFFTREDVVACFDGHANAAPAAAAPETAEAAPAAAPAPAAKDAAVDDEHKFFRDGARYVCRNCQKKFFTRGDVGQCFDSHAAA